MTESQKLREYREERAHEERQFEEALRMRLDAAKSSSSGLRRSFLLYEFGAKVFGYAPWILGAIGVAAILPFLGQHPAGTFLIVVLFVCLKPLERILARIRKEGSGWLTGVPAGETDLPDLHAMVREVSDKLGVPPPAILINEGCDINAQVRIDKKSRGVKSKELVIGASILMSMGREELRGLLALTIADFKTGGADLLRRIGRLNNQIERLLPHLDTAASGWHRILLPLVRSYKRRLRPINAAIIRIVGQEADVLALQAAPKLTLTNALLRSEMVQRSLRRGFYEERWTRNRRVPWDTEEEIRELLAASKELLSSDLGAAALRMALSDRMPSRDLYPRFVDRLETLDVSTESADAAYRERFASEISPALDPEPLTQFCERALLKRFESYKKWAEGVQERHLILQERLEKMRKERSASPSAMWLGYYAALTWMAEQPLASREPLEEARALFPEDGSLTALYGGCLLVLKDGQGIELAEEGIRLDWTRATWLLPYLRDYYYLQGDRESYDRTITREAENDVREAFVEREVQTLSKDDRLEVCDQSDPRLAVLKESAEKIEHVERLYCVTKTTATTRDLPIRIVVALVQVSAMSDFSRMQSSEWLESELELPLSSVLIVPALQAPWRAQLDKVPGALLFERPMKGYL